MGVDGRFQADRYLEIELNMRIKLLGFLLIYLLERDEYLGDASRLSTKWLVSPLHARVSWAQKQDRVIAG
jgi:hypothetical protein